MSLLYPIYLLGALAIALPLYLHLKRKPPRESTPVSSLLFWNASETLSNRRMAKLEDWLLLLLRILAILFLVLVFARPFLNNESLLSLTNQTVSRYSIVIDTSASMRREGTWQSAKDLALSQIKKIKARDQVAVYHFDHQVSELISYTSWQDVDSGQRKSLLSQKINSLSPGWGSSRIDLALLRAIEAMQEQATLDEGPVERSEVILITDLQQGSEWERLTSMVWPEEIELSVLRVDSDFTQNASLNTVASADPSQPRVRITNHPKHSSGSFKLNWTAADLYETHYIAPGQSVVVSAPAGFPPGSPLELFGDGIEFDNTVYFPPPEPAQPLLSLWTDSLVENADSLAFYLDQAMINTHRMEPRLESRATENVDFYIADGSLTDSDSQHLLKELQAGKTCLLVIDRPEASTALRTLLADSSIEVRAATTGRDYTLFEQVDFKHPVLRPFAAIETRDFSNIRVWNYQLVDLPDTRTLISYEDGSPALFEKTIGQGTLYGITTSWSKQDSQLALSTKFVPFLYSLLHHSGIRPGASASFTVGDILPLDRDFPSDLPITIDGQRAQQPYQADRPGFYPFAQGDKQVTYIVNLDPRESLLEPMDLDTFSRFGIDSVQAPDPDDSQLAPPGRTLTEVELENQQKWFRWLACLVFIFILVETLIGSRRRSSSSATATPEAT